jgi:HEAT repeat protein
VEHEEVSVEASRLSTAELFRAARLEVSGDDSDDPVPHLVALHERPTREVFDTAARMLSDDDPAVRELGAMVLRELGPYNNEGRRPFTAQAVPLLVDRLNREDQPRVLGWVISALGYNGAREALGEVLPFVEHPHRRVRFHVAAALPSLVDRNRSSRRQPRRYGS